jgi:TetR/AcrR family transcriptional regulator, transcriptional repressor for nem operon
MAPSRHREADTASMVLDAAERLVQTRGFTDFSYADVATELGITRAALHYHFAEKADLGAALIERYTTRFVAELDAIDAATETGPAKLDRYVQLYLDVLENGRMCLCGMLAAEYETLPTKMQAAVRGFFDTNEKWLARVFEDGRRNATLEFGDSAEQAARLVVSGLQGAMLVARPYGDSARFESAAKGLLATFGPRPSLAPTA